MKYKAILLDVDGVLIDSEKVFNASWRQAAEEMGYAMSYEQALELRSLDSTLAKGLFMKWYGHEDAYPAIRQRRKTIMAERNSIEKLAGKPGVMDFLKGIKQYHIKVAIVTSSPVCRITEYLESAGIDISLFDKVITTESVKRGKPYPDIYQYACKTMGLSPTECIAVEDSPNGVRSSHDAGCYTIMIPDITQCTNDLEYFVDQEIGELSLLLDFICDKI